MSCSRRWPASWQANVARNSILRAVMDRHVLLRSEAIAAGRRKGGESRKGKKRTTQAERDEIASYLARQPEPFRG